MSKFKRYSEYKESGVDWIGEIPSHWNVNRNIQLFEQRVETGRTDLPILEVSIHTGVSVRDMENGRKQIMEDFSSYKIAHKDDLAYNMMRMWQGAVGIVPETGFVSPAYVVVKPRKPMNTKYYEYLFRTPLYKNEANRASRGIVEDRNRLYWDGFKQITSFNPPEDEKNQITTFLDNETAKIDTFIANKQKLIELLKEQKTAIINKAVTKGLNPDAPMKDSGIEWLGEIPAHWEVKRIKSEIQLLTGFPFSSSDYSDEGIKLARGINVKEGMFNWDDTAYWRTITPDLTKYLLEDGDILIGMDGSKVGKNFCFVQNDDLPILLLQRVARLRTKPNLNNRFLYWNIACSNFLYWVTISKTDPMVPHIAPSDINNYRIAFPPSEEQKEIVIYLENETAKVDDLIQRVEKEIALIQEYRQSLITNAVTGKIDVRELV